MEKRFKKKVIEKTQEMYFDKCPRCDKEIEGFSEKQVNQRMSMHQIGCNQNNKKGELGQDLTKDKTKSYHD